MKIVVVDGYTENPGDLSWDALNEFGEVIIYDRQPEDDAVISAAIGDADILIANKCTISADTIARCTNLKYITVLATGYNIVDISAAKARGIPVSNVPSYGTEAVGQAAIAMLLEITNRVGHHAAAVSEGRWSRCADWTFWDYPLIELSGKTIGIIGFGRIGQVTGRVAKALGMNVLAYSRSVREDGRQIGEYVSLDTLLARSDVIALHAPLFPETQNIINKDNIAKMKDGVIIINNSRGGLIVEQDLADALNCGKVAAAALDVVSTEPVCDTNPLLHAKNCLITPHISWASKECRQRILDTTVSNIRAFLAGEPVNVVNK